MRAPLAAKGMARRAQLAWKADADRWDFVNLTKLF